MKKIYYSILVIMCCLLYACTSEREQSAAAQAAALSGAEDYTISESKSTEADGSHRDLVVTLKSIQSNETNEKIASTSALTIFGTITKEDYKDYDRIRIVIERDASTFEQAYPIDKLEISTPFLKKLLNVFRQDAGNNYALPLELFDSGAIQDSTLLQFKNILVRLDTDYGKLSNVAVSSFKFDKLKNPTVDILMAHITASNGLMLTDYTFYFSFTTRKIIYIGINENSNL